MLPAPRTSRAAVRERGWGDVARWPCILKATLRPVALARLGASPHRFCAIPACSVAYFGRHESFGRSDVGVPVFQKEPVGQR